PDRHRVRWSTTDVVDLALRRFDALGGQLISAHEIFDVQHVAHLLAVAVDRDWLARYGGDDEPSHPALVLDAHLPWPVDTRLTEDDGPQAVDSVVVADVLVRGAFRATVGRVKVERLA